MALRGILLIGLLSFVLFQCNSVQKTEEPAENQPLTPPIHHSEGKQMLSESHSKSRLERQMIEAGLVDIQLLEPSIEVQLQYASDSNFLKQVIYDSLSKAYLEINTAKKLALAHIYLTQKYPHLRLLIWDAARPISCQLKMWNSLQMPAVEKGRFVSNPKNHSLHNYGCAVDLSLMDTSGNLLDMGTTFDQFDSTAQPKYEWYCFQRGLLTRQHLHNRDILRQVMKEAGFTGISSEWWHFNACTREFAKANYVVIH